MKVLKEEKQKLNLTTLLSDKITANWETFFYRQNSRERREHKKKKRLRGLVAINRSYEILYVQAITLRIKPFAGRTWRCNRITADQLKGFISTGEIKVTKIAYLSTLGEVIVIQTSKRCHFLFCFVDLVDSWGDRIVDLPQWKLSVRELDLTWDSDSFVYLHLSFQRLVRP